MIDSRPSDAIALALRTKSPIYVAKAVLEASSVLQQNEEGKEATVENVSNVSKEKWAEILEKMAPEISSISNNLWPSVFRRCRSLTDPFHDSLNMATAVRDITPQRSSPT